MTSGDTTAAARVSQVLSGREDLTIQGTVRTIDDVQGARGADVFVLAGAGNATETASAVRELRKQRCDVHIVVIWDSNDRRGARCVVDAGADGLVFLDRLELALVPTILAVVAGQSSLPREMADTTPVPAFSSREKQILGMVVMGFTNREISARLFLAESTVKSHLSSAFAKLGVRSRSQAAAKILDPQGSLGMGILALTAGGPVPSDLDQGRVSKPVGR